MGAGRTDPEGEALMTLDVLREVAEANRDALDEELARRMDELIGGGLREGIPVEVWRKLAPPLE